LTPEKPPIVIPDASGVEVGGSCAATVADNCAESTTTETDGASGEVGRGICVGIEVDSAVAATGIGSGLEVIVGALIGARGAVDVGV